MTMMARDKQTVEPESYHTPSTAPSDMVIQRLLKLGVPAPYLERKELGLVQYVREGRIGLREMVAALLPGTYDMEPSSSSVSAEETRWKPQLKQQYREGLRWIQWLMFEGDPNLALERIRALTGGQKGVCGAVWGSNDIAYKCRTCENDPTCAICVPCFLAGNHQNHDYMMIHTGGGCCDCGDGTAWKPTGFCSQHKGPGQVPPLPGNFTKTAQPVLTILLVEWTGRLQVAEKLTDRKPKKWETTEGKTASKLSAAMVEMLLLYCDCSESMLMFVASLVGSSKIGLLNTLLQIERFLPKKIIGLLHELLFKLMADQNFKFQFAKVFIEHYPHFICDDIHEELESTAITHASSRLKDNRTLSTFSVQIFTVPTLTPRLVIELGLLDMLFESMKEIFLNSAGDDGRLKVSKGPIASSLYYRVLEDIRYVMSHKEVAQFVSRERLDLFKSWLCLLACTQGMDPQKRVTTFHVEEESESWFFTYCLEVQMACIHPLFVDGAATVGTSICNERSEPQQLSLLAKKNPDEDKDALLERHAKVGRTSKNSDVIGITGASNGMSDMEMDNRGGAMHHISMEDTCVNEASASVVGMDGSSPLDLPAALLRLIFECLKVLFTWLDIDACKIAKSNRGSTGRKDGQRRGKGRGIRGLIRDAHGSITEESATMEVKDVPERGNTIREWLCCDLQRPHADSRRAENTVNQSIIHKITVNTEDGSKIDIDMSIGRGDQKYAVILDKNGLPITTFMDWWMGSDMTDGGLQFSFLSSYKEWPVFDFDVSRQEISFHIPLHRMLATLLKKCVSIFAADSGSFDNSMACDRILGQTFIEQLFPPVYQSPGFSAILMEHPLRIQVFCAQVCAGMWRRNGHSVLTLRDYYHSVRWCEDSLDLDLFLLQCCGVMDPPDDFVETIKTRFGLCDYFSPYPSSPNEYEPTLAQEMLTLLIQIVCERNFCGFSMPHALRRELIVRLAISDAPRSHLIKSLPPRLSDNQQLQHILDSVATYCNPSGMKQGKYSLRKECWEELDLYHPRWTARELQSAEDRYMRACGTSAVFKQLPRWRKPYAPLQSLNCIATCRRVHDILHSVFSHAISSDKISESSAPESVLIVALHLLALALDICEQNSHGKGMNSQTCVPNESCSSGLSDSSSTMDVHETPPLLTRATEKARVGIAEGHSLLSLLVMLMRRYASSNIQAATIEANQCNVGDLIRSLLGRFASLHHGCMYEIESLAPELLHRVSSGLHSEAKGKDEQIQPSERERRKALARQCQEAVMAKMKAAQEKFVGGLQPADEGNVSERDVSDSNESKGKKMKDLTDSEKTSQESMSAPCALCRDIGSRNRTSFLTLVQRSRLIAIAEKGIPAWDNGMQSQDGGGQPTRQRGTNSGNGSDDTVFDDSQSSIELWNFIQMVVEGDTGRRPLVLEPLMDFIRAELHGNFEIAHTMPGGQVADMSISGSIVSEAGSENSIAEDIIGNDRDAVANLHCDVTQHEEDHVDRETREIAIFNVLVEYLKVLRKHHEDNEASSAPAAPQSRRASSIRSAAQGGIEMLPFQNIGSNDSIGVHISSCGHAVHQECLDRYLSSLLQRYLSRTLFEGLQIVDPQQGEFLCPVCRRLANSVLPALQSCSKTADSFAGPLVSSCLPQSGRLSFKPLLEDGTSVLTLPCQLHQALSLLHKAEFIWNMEFSKVVPKSLLKSMRAVLSSLFSRLCELYFSDKESSDKSVQGRSSQSLLLWDVLRYTIICTEVASRTRKQKGDSFESENCLDTLWRAADSSQGSILPLVLQAAKVIQDLNRQEVLLRVRGMQLFVGSICYGISQDSISESFIPGNISKVLNLIDLTKQPDAPDLQFWRRAADPVLIHDPFSSLLWLVFCMPSSFLISLELFISMVHLLYLVCLIQAIAVMDTQVASDAQLSNGAQAFMQTLSSTLKDTPLSVNSDEHTLMLSPLVMIRRLTLPFLRRCALLQRLLFDISSSQSFETERFWGYLIPDTTDLHMIDVESRQTSIDFLGELKQYGELERIFFLPPPQAFLEDKFSQELSLKWCQHLLTVKSSRTFQHISRPSFAIPFQLMRLPLLYQDLLQRYIKKRCPVCSTVPDQPALCLLCGALCCAYSRRACCSTNRQTECYKHALTCGAGIGVFLLIRKTTILLQRCARQASWPSPYLDAFGEEDIDVTRGKPLYLSKERYADLTLMVASHGLDHCSLVLNQTTREAVIWG